MLYLALSEGDGVDVEMCCQAQRMIEDREFSFASISLLYCHFVLFHFISIIYLQFDLSSEEKKRKKEKNKRRTMWCDNNAVIAKLFENAD